MTISIKLIGQNAFSMLIFFMRLLLTIKYDSDQKVNPCPHIILNNELFWFKIIMWKIG